MQREKYINLRSGQQLSSTAAATSDSQRSCGGLPVDSKRKAGCLVDTALLDHVERHLGTLGVVYVASDHKSRITLKLPPDVERKEFIDVALELGVAIGSAPHAGQASLPHDSSCIRLDLTSEPLERIHTGIELLARLIRAIRMAG